MSLLCRLRGHDSIRSSEATLYTDTEQGGKHCLIIGQFQLCVRCRHREREGTTVMPIGAY